MVDEITWFVQLIIENQIAAMGLFAVAGVIVVAILASRFGGKKRFWGVVDLVWIAMGGASAIGAVVGSIYAQERTSFEQEIITAAAKVQLTVSLGEQFLARYCEGNFDSVLYYQEIGMICKATKDDLDIVKRNQASLRVDEILDSISERGSVDQFFMSDAAKMSMQDLIRSNRGLIDLYCDGGECKDVFKFSKTTVAKETLKRSFIFDQLIRDHDLFNSGVASSIDEISGLELKWDRVAESFRYLMLRSVSLALLAFAFPFRLGKSVREVLVK